MIGSMEFIAVMYIALLYYSAKKAVDSHIFLNKLINDDLCDKKINETIFSKKNKCIMNIDDLHKF